MKKEYFILVAILIGLVGLVFLTGVVRATSCPEGEVWSNEVEYVEPVIDEVCNRWRLVYCFDSRSFKWVCKGYRDVVVEEGYWVGGCVVDENYVAPEPEPEPEPIVRKGGQRILHWTENPIHNKEYLNEMKNIKEGLGYLEQILAIYIENPEYFFGR